MNQLRHQLHRRRQSSISRTSLKVRKMITRTADPRLIFISMKSLLSILSILYISMISCQNSETVTPLIVDPVICPVFDIAFRQPIVFDGFNRVAVGIDLYISDKEELTNFYITFIYLGNDGKWEIVFNSNDRIKRKELFDYPDSVRKFIPTINEYVGGIFIRKSRCANKSMLKKTNKRAIIIYNDFFWNRRRLKQQYDEIIRNESG